MSLDGAVLCGHVHISDVAMVPRPADTHQDVVWFDVSMGYRFRMNVAEPVNELVGNHQHCLRRKFAPAKFERSPKLGPRRSKTVTSYSPSPQYQWTCGMPVPPARVS